MITDPIGTLGLILVLVGGFFILVGVQELTKRFFSKKNNASQGTGTVSMFMVGGGGAGGNSTHGQAGHGGGSGGVVHVEKLSVVPGSYSVVVGQGGTNESDGGNSTFNNTIIAEGGKGGGSK